MLIVMVWISALSIYEEDEIEYYLIWFTNWSQLLCIITVVVRVISTGIIMFRDDMTPEILRTDLESLRSLSPLLRRLYTVQSILSQTALSMTSGAAIAYWVAQNSTYSSHDPKLKNVNKFQVHGVNALYMWIDYLISAERVECKSIIWSLTFWTLYTIWNIIFEFTIKEVPDDDGPQKYIYEVTDWSAGVQKPLMMYVVGLIALCVVTILAVCVKNMILVRQQHVFVESIEKELAECQTHDERSQMLMSSGSISDI